LVDLGDTFTVYDKDGEPNLEIKLDTIENSTGIVTVAKGQKHPL